MAKQKDEVVKVLPGKSGKWEIFKKKNPKTGMKEYCTRLIARNGYIICGNSGFNSVAGAVKNIRAVRKAC